MKLRSVAIVLACLVSVGVSVAADDPIAERRKIMQDNERIQSKLNQLVLGKYFADKALAQLQKLEANLSLFPTLFPPDSDTGGGTHAAAAIWSDKAAFEAMAAEFVEKVRAAETASTNGQDALNIAIQPVFDMCAGCHATYAPDVIM